MTAGRSPSYLAITNLDPNLALVGLRIEIEKRLRALAVKHNLRSALSMTRVLKELRTQGILPETTATSLGYIIGAGNQAAHGARVEPEVSRWAIDTGPSILDALDTELG